MKAREKALPRCHRYDDRQERALVHADGEVPGLSREEGPIPVAKTRGGWGVDRVSRKTEKALEPSRATKCDHSAAMGRREVASR